MEDLMRQKCEEYDISFDVLTDEEKAKLREEIKAEQKGLTVSDTILEDPEIVYRSSQQ